MKNAQLIYSLASLLLTTGTYIGHAQDQGSAADEAHMVSPYLTNNILGISGIDLGLVYGRYNVIPRDPYTGNSVLLGSSESLTKPIQKVNMYSISFQMYGSLIGRKLLKNKDRKFIIADKEALGVSLGSASESGKQFDGSTLHSLTGKPGPNKTIGSFINVAFGAMAAYRINNHMRASVSYQYLIDQGFIFYSWIGLDHSRNFDLSRKVVAGALTYKQYLAEASVSIGWKYGDSPYGNKGWGILLKERIGGNNKHLGAKLDFVYQRKSPQAGTRNWHSIMLFYGVGI
jgi:hypothetical protein